MESERMRILDRLHAGEITVSQAQELLQTVTNGGSTSPGVTDQPAQAASAEDLEAAIRLQELPNPLTVQPPDFDRFRRWWRIPFAIGLMGVVVLGALLVTMTRDAAGQVTLALVFTWPAFVGAGVLALLAVWSRHAQWLQLRVEQPDGRRLRVSLPVPVGMVGRVVTLVRLVVPPARVRWENAGTLLTDMRQSTNQAPLLLDSHDESGVHVQIYVG